ncbi:hypothetical protein D922_04460 [Enterococcus faecalis 06-MB-DW-09]|nr:hypothetical protein D922_04460 [Enterococcus faecalis 06-MB-DW-09]
MTRKEALQIGEVIANRWWKYNKPLIQSKQHIQRMKERRQEHASIQR